jgi:ABC-type nitrate/sulfonate/bicarbonate transport system permease component
VIVRRPSRNGSRQWYESHERLILGIVGVSIILVPWELLSRFGLVRSVLLSSPSAVAGQFIRELQRGDIWGHIWVTFVVWAIGFSLAAILGILLGLLGGWFRRVGYVADPWLQILYASPDLAFIPLFIIWFGLGLEFRVWVVFTGILFWVAVNTMAGVRMTEQRFIEVAQTFGASQLVVFKSIVLPGSTAHIMTGLRQASARGIVGVVGAEFIAANQGIGYMILAAGATLQTARLFVGIGLLMLFGIVTNEVLTRIERLLEPWRAEVLE